MYTAHTRPRALKKSTPSLETCVNFVKIYIALTSVTAGTGRDLRRPLPVSDFTFDEATHLSEPNLVRCSQPF